MESIEEKIRRIEEDFSMFDQWVDKYAYIIDLGKSLPIIDEKYRDEDHLIRGCQSQVWLAAELSPEGNVVFTADSDALITKGIISLLVNVASRRPPTRANGLYEMIRQMKYYGAALAAGK